MALNDSFLQELKYKTDIEDVISTYVSLKEEAQPLSAYVRSIMKRLRHSRFIPTHSPFIASDAAQAETLLDLLRKLKILIIWTL